ncbi:tumor necrosis factor receptor superfamily member 11B-like [Chanos chanos]|uniref:Tumor necrosis factor receptor superfamily member 11B-like n=1 Tax=Chanos chanos TaxID=29144 RepID=A0A6J2W6S9_CHACN|nr:tumor necrosis factor receptor superfamily member 11B-like [Chanos chanos]
MESDTYLHEDPKTGETLTCDRCPPGTHMSYHCNRTSPTVCSPCPKNHFTQYSNYLSKCLYCSTFCVDNQIIKEECSPKSNRVCDCKEGYYWRADFCVKHSECPTGFGVKEKGTVHKNTECERCPRGTYSDSLSLDPCVNHTDCASAGLIVALKGTSWHDNICASCDDLKNEGGLVLLKNILPNFFAHENLRVGRMRRFVRYHLQNGLKQPFYGYLTLSEKKQILFQRIKRWADGATTAQLKQLPEMLLDMHLPHAADKLAKIIRALENPSKCNISTRPRYTVNRI